MKRRIKKTDLVLFLQELDTRIEDKTPEWVDRAITNGFAELGTITQQFSTETAVNLEPYYETGETRFTINLKQDSTAIYDMYLLAQDVDELRYMHGEYKERNKNLIYQDPQNNNAVNVDLLAEIVGPFSAYDSAVVKYHYTPNAEFDDIYISGDVYLALENALAASAYDMLHDVEKASQKRSAMARTGTAIVDTYPTDFFEPGRPSMFPSGV